MADDFAGKAVIFVALGAAGGVMSAEREARREVAGAAQVVARVLITRMSKWSK